MTLGEWSRRLSWSVIVPAALLVGLGWNAIGRVEELAGASNRFLPQQVIFSLMALAVMVTVTVPNYRVLCRYSYVIFVVATLLLVAVYFFPPINNAHRWMRIGPIGFQPSEAAKLAYVLAMARYLMYRDNYRRLSGLAAPVLLTLIPVLLVLKEPNLGTALVFLPVCFAMLFAAGAKLRDLACVALVGMLMVPLLWTQMSPAQKARITALVDQPPPGHQPTGDAYHLHVAKRVRALGGVWGSSFSGQPTDDPRAYFLPEARSDFVFSIVGERFGLPGMALVLASFAVIVGRALAIAAETREPFGRLLAAGIAALLAVEALINTGMTVGLLPITGLSLPLVSYGGSGLLVNGAALGLLLNVALWPGYEMTNEPFRYVVDAA